MIDSYVFTSFVFSALVFIGWIAIVNLYRLAHLIRAGLSSNECERNYYHGLYQGSSWTRPVWDLSTSNRIRDFSCEQWGWAVPTSFAVSAIVKAAITHDCSYIVDYGAGRGYWSHLIAKQARPTITVVAVDANPTWYTGACHHPLIAGGIGSHGARRDDSGSAAAADERTAREWLGRRGALLLLVWPPCWSPMAADALDAFAGPALAYVGESPGGRTASAAFFARLAAGWLLRRRVPLPTWAGCSDALHIYSRRGGAGPL